MRSISLTVIASMVALGQVPDDVTGPDYLQISGIYPHLAAFNHPAPGESGSADGLRECGIGAVAPWAGSLWYITYPPHKRSGSNDKLHQVGEDLSLTIREESVGGTHACRMVHRESKQLIIGPYFIDESGGVRSADLRKLEGRMTAVARHLDDPENLVYFFDMEGTLYEVNVHDLSVTKLFDKPVPGWHGKGAYTAQGRLVMANNGEHAAGERSYEGLLVGGEAEGEEAGVLAEWDGTDWRIVERKQFTDVTGPGGIEGGPSDDSPLWSMGWDRRSVILKLLDGGIWTTFRVPKGSYTFDPRHGWYTEWPRIREVAPDTLMMVMHGTMFNFPSAFSLANRSGIRPLATHLRYIPDFCHWQGQVILASDDTAILQNSLAGQPQSNLWFGPLAELESFGPRSGWGGVWSEDVVRAGEASEPFLIKGYDTWCLHLTTGSAGPVRFRLEIDTDGTGSWQAFDTVDITAAGYAAYIPSRPAKADWIRLVPEGDGVATAYFHLASTRKAGGNDDKLFASLADVNHKGEIVGGLVRPAKHHRGLQFLAETMVNGKTAGTAQYLEVMLDNGQALAFQAVKSRAKEVRKTAVIETNFEVDRMSVVMTTWDGKRYRLPKGPLVFDGTPGVLRDIRECVSERFLANVHGTFYEIPRAKNGRSPDIEKLKPVSSHTKRITDFCTWRGLMVLSGTRRGASPDGNYFATEDGRGLWFGSIDDLWKLGKPVGNGGPWLETRVEAGELSDPYLMTGYDEKTLMLSHDSANTIAFELEVSFDLRGWHVYKTFAVSPGGPLKYRFPEGFHAHWARLRAGEDCIATAQFEYR